MAGGWCTTPLPGMAEGWCIVAPPLPTALRLPPEASTHALKPASDSLILEVTQSLVPSSASVIVLNRSMICCVICLCEACTSCFTSSRRRAIVAMASSPAAEAASVRAPMADRVLATSPASCSTSSWADLTPVSCASPRERQASAMSWRPAIWVRNCEVSLSRRWRASSPKASKLRSTACSEAARAEASWARSCSRESKRASIFAWAAPSSTMEAPWDKCSCPKRGNSALTSAATSSIREARRTSACC
mmetsp:Transcript_62641/g.134503  ORF Transcript_62641/g.134503 Transcript_62641/m.134503 type:complete len:248 (-) Transcript_62641:15-758(-)